MLEDSIEVLTEQLIKENFNSKVQEEDRYIITKEDLIKFSIRLLKLIREVYRVEEK